MRTWTCLFTVVAIFSLSACDSSGGGGDTDTDTDGTSGSTTMVDPSSPTTTPSTSNGTTTRTSTTSDDSSSGDPSEGSSSSGGSSSGDGSTSGGSSSTGASTSAYEGLYEGTFEGDCPDFSVSGTIELMIDADGIATGAFTGNDSGPLDGMVDSDGALETSGEARIAGLCNYDGQIDGDLMVEGTWGCPDFECGGTWTAGPVVKE